MCSVSIEPSVFKIDDGAIEIVGSRLDGPDGQWEQFWPILSPQERARADRFVHDLHRRRFIVARGRLRQLLAHRLGDSPAMIGISAADGKPKLCERWARSGLRFNVSHSDELAVYAFARGREVGVDVELISDIPQEEALVARFYSPTERAALTALPCEQRKIAFFAWWTRKEAFLKALGCGLGYPLTNFSVTVDPDGPARITQINGSEAEAQVWAMASFRLSAAYIGAVAYQTKGDSPPEARFPASDTTQVALGSVGAAAASSG